MLAWIRIRGANQVSREDARRDVLQVRGAHRKNSAREDLRGTVGREALRRRTRDGDRREIADRETGPHLEALDLAGDAPPDRSVGREDVVRPPRRLELHVRSAVRNGLRSRSTPSVVGGPWPE